MMTEYLLSLLKTFMEGVMLALGAVVIALLFSAKFGLAA